MDSMLISVFLPFYQKLYGDFLSRPYSPEVQSPGPGRFNSYPGLSMYAGNQMVMLLFHFHRQHLELVQIRASLK